MRKQPGSRENLVFLAAALLTLLATVGAWLIEPRLHLANPRLQYGMKHLPAALAGVFLFTVLVGLAQVWLTGRGRLDELPVGWYVLGIVAVFCAFWLPPLLAGGFNEDDWILLAAASIRKVVLAHPGYSWWALDSVDGNFRPLGTVLYFGYMWRWFGLWAQPYLAGLFVANLLGTLMGFAVVRELGYSRVAAAAAALLFLSRGLTYSIETWPAALGDGLVILLCSVTALLILQANKHTGFAAAGLHVAAWGCFSMATLAKQSSFAMPLIVGLLLWLRPGQETIPALRDRVLTALAGVAAYGATAAVVFFHAKALVSGAKPPYPIEFSFKTLLSTFSYASWYLLAIGPPDRLAWIKTAISVVGGLLVLGVVVLFWRQRMAIGRLPRDLVFCGLAAVASISLFVVLPLRIAPYYGSMMAFWISIGLGIALTRAANRTTSAMLFCGLLLSGFVDVRLKQTGLFPSGGYTWGTFGVDAERREYAQLRDRLAQAPDARVLVLSNVPGIVNYVTAMALVAGPKLEHVLVYDLAKQQFLTNDREGARPGDDKAALREWKAFDWTAPADAVEAGRLTLGKGVLRLKFHDGKIEPGI